jgi:succinoglycan biosynthesis protein ExoH
MTAANPAAPAPAAGTAPVHRLHRASPAAAAIRPREASLSSAIEVARVLLVIGLVFLHYFSFPNLATSPFLGMDPHHHPVATFVNSFVLFFFFSAVPLLSAISGWLFFGFERGDARAAIAARLRKRAGSLVAPMIAWNFLAVALWRAAPSSGLFSQFGFDPAAAGVLGAVDAVFGITRLPIAFQFWFIHDLILTVLASPLLWLLLRRAPFAGAALLGAAWLAEFNLWGVFVRADVPFFFYLGALARTRGLDPRIGWTATVWLLGLYTALMALRALAPLAVDMEAPEQRALVELATRLARPLGVVACWGVCLRLAALPSGAAVARWGGAAFFLHAAHYPLIAFVKFALWKAVPAETDAWMLAHYIASVSATVLLCALAAVALFRLSPRLYAFLAGGRSLA